MKGRTLAALVVAVLVGGGASSAQAATTSFVSMFSDGGDYIGGGSTKLFHAPESQVTVQGDASSVTVSVSNPGNFNMRFDAPSGQTLAGGVYDRAERASFKSAGRPGIDINGDGRGCNTVKGRFEVRDIATDASGGIARLWIVYEQHCEGAYPALWGEVRFNESSGTEQFTAASPFIVRWPPTDLGRRGRTVPVSVFADHTMKFGRTSVTGTDASSFPIRLDECTGKSLSAGDSCRVWIAFDPSAAGSREATLHIETVTGADNASVLQGLAYGGTTEVVLHSDPGDYVGAGQDLSYTPANALIQIFGTREHVHFSVTGADASYWTADLAAGSGDILAPGTFVNAHQYPSQGTGPGLDVSGQGRTCDAGHGQFTVTEASFDSDGPTNFGSTFVQRCETSTAALRGSLDFRAGDNTAPAPWMTTRAGATPLGFAPAHTQPSSGPCSGTRFSEAWVIVGTSADDSLAGTSGMDIISGLSGGDAIGGSGGDDCLDGGAGNDRLLGGTGNDLLAGGKDDDTLIGGPGQDKFKCGPGDDTVYAEPGESVDADCEHVNR